MVKILLITMETAHTNPPIRIGIEARALAEFQSSTHASELRPSAKACGANAAEPKLAAWASRTAQNQSLRSMVEF